MNDHERLRRNLRDALPTRPGFPSASLLDRIMWDVSRRGRRGPDGRRRWTWVQGAAGFLALIVLVGLLDGKWAPVSANAGRVEFVSAGPVEFLSSQAQPDREYREMTDKVLARFNGRPDFNSQSTGTEDIARIKYEHAAGRSTVDVIALTHGEMAAVQDSGALEDLTPLLRRLQEDRGFPQPLLDDGRLGTDHQYYIPWLQATYLMVVNKQALQYLPPGANYQHLTYDQLVAWGENMRARTGRNRIGLPADLNLADGALLHRFLQGYTYPSYTGTTLTGFDSPEAVPMWQMLRRLWSVTNPASTTYASMDEPLVRGDVWVAWDHQVRLADALADSNDFLAVPAPSGPVGQGYMSVLVGLAIPQGAPNQRGAEALIDWLTRPEQQAAAAASLSFFPVVHGVQLAGAQAPELEVDQAYRHNKRAVETLLPVGLGTNAGAFNGAYLDAFRRIVLQGEDIPTVLAGEAAILQQIVSDSEARCWPPDPPSQGPCPILIR